MNIKITQIGKLFAVTIDGNTIQNVTDYKIISSAHGSTELELKIGIPSEITEFVTEAKTIKNPLSNPLSTNFFP